MTKFGTLVRQPVPQEDTMPSSARSVDVERRANRRNRALKPALLRFNDGFLSADAVIRDTNESGIRVRFADTDKVPSAVIVVLEGGKLTRNGRIVWRSNTEAGIHFA
ncbi:MAG: hypothetical protein WBO55_18335 [Rhizobiaceae bacterium]